MLSFAGQSPGSRVSCGVTRDGAGGRVGLQGPERQRDWVRAKAGRAERSPPIRQPGERMRRGRPARGGALYSCPREPRIRALPPARPESRLPPPASALGPPLHVGALPEPSAPKLLPLPWLRSAPRPPPWERPVPPTWPVRSPPCPCERTPANPCVRPRRGSSRRPCPDRCARPHPLERSAPLLPGRVSVGGARGRGAERPSHCPPSRNPSPSPSGAPTWSRRGPWVLARGAGAELARPGARAPPLGGHER